jgi:cell fate regulator YaaT (PSP1 superfamily)
MTKWFLIRFSTAGDLYRVRSDMDDLHEGDNVIVKTHRGREFGCVVRVAQDAGQDLQVAEAQALIESRADEKDLEKEYSNRDK